MKRLLVLSTVIALTAIGTGVAYSSQSEQNDSALRAKAEVSLTQAIAAAESHVNGKAVNAELENENGNIVYGVEVVNSTQTVDVKVDAHNGKILSAQLDREDHEDEGTEHEEKGERGSK
jgi:uncharacterized membrane protein YkoI